MERYFDAHLYLANWGTHILMFRVPAAALDIEVARQYFGSAAARLGRRKLVKLAADDAVLDLLGEPQQ